MMNALGICTVLSLIASPICLVQQPTTATIAQQNRQQQPAIQFGYFILSDTTDIEKEVRGWYLKVLGKFTNTSNRRFQARTIRYQILTKTGRVLVTNEEYLLPSMEVVSIDPGEETWYAHSLNQQQTRLVRSVPKHELRFRFLGFGTRMINKIPVIAYNSNIND